MLRSTRFTAALTFMWALLAVGSPSAHAQAPIRFNLPAQPLAAALQAVATQTSVNVLFDPPVVANLMAPELRAVLTCDQALTKLLAGTELTYEFLSERTVAIRSAKVGGSGLPSNINRGDKMRIASNEPRNTHNKNSPDDSVNDETPQVVVKGQQDRPAPFSTANIDLTRTEDDVLPFDVFTAEEIAQSGAADLDEFLRTRLTQAQSRTDHERTIGFNGTDVPQAAINSYHIGGSAGTPGQSSEIAVFLNGRRLPSRFIGLSDDSGTVMPNIRGIPMASIERVELLTSAASAIYGEGATAAVINVITKQDHQGGSVSVSYKSPVDVHVPRRAVDLLYAMPVKWGMNLRLVYSLQDVEPLTVRNRAHLAERRRRHLQERDPTYSFYTRNYDAPLAATPNIYTLSGGLFGPGTARITTVPDGYAGGGDLSVFQPGIFNMELSDGGGGFHNQLGKGTALGNRTRDTNYVVGLDKSLNQQWQLSFEYSHQESRYRTDNVVFLNFRVPASAPTNPFNQTVFVRAYDPRLDRPEYFSKFSNARNQLSVTLRGDHREWRSLFDVTVSHDENDINSAALSTFSTLMSNALATGAYNPLIDMRVTAPASDEFYRSLHSETSVLEMSSATRNFQATSKASGPVWRLPAGAMLVTAGLEWQRNDRYKASRDISSSVGRGSTEVIPSHYVFDAYSMYAEASAPLLAGRENVPFVDRFELFGSARFGRQYRSGFRRNATSYESTQDADGFVRTRTIYDVTPSRYETESYLYAVGFRYDVANGLALRVSRSIGFKPPQFSQTVPSLPPDESSNPIRVTDRRTGAERDLTPTMYVTGGNPDVEPETTQSTGMGLILEPHRIDGLRISADYMESVRNDAIISASPQQILDFEITDPALAGRVHRNAGGEITFVDARAINLFKVAARRVDLRTDYAIDNVGRGRVTLSAAVTKNISYRIQSSLGMEPQEHIRNPVAAYNSSLPKWNGNMQMRWQGRRWTFGWSARYLDQSLISPSGQVLQGSDRIPSAWDHDAFAVYQFERNDNGRGMRNLFSDLTVNFGVKNVFDREPRFAYSSEIGIIGVDSAYGRILWLQMNKDL